MTPETLRKLADAAMEEEWRTRVLNGGGTYHSAELRGRASAFREVADAIEAEQAERKPVEEAQRRAELRAAARRHYGWPKP